MIFHYIESADGETKQKRAVVLTGSDIQSRGDLYSQEPKGSESEAGKFVIPFFDDEYEMVEEQELEEGPSTDSIYEEINRRISETLKENKTGKFRWEQRGLIKELKKKLVKKK